MWYSGNLPNERFILFCHHHPFLDLHTFPCPHTTPILVISLGFLPRQCPSRHTAVIYKLVCTKSSIDKTVVIGVVTELTSPNVTFCRPTNVAGRTA